MKKLRLFASVALASTFLLGITSCGNDNNSQSIPAPDKGSSVDEITLKGYTTKTINSSMSAKDVFLSVVDVMKMPNSEGNVCIDYKYTDVEYEDDGQGGYRTIKSTTYGNNAYDAKYNGHPSEGTYEKVTSTSYFDRYYDFSFETDDPYYSHPGYSGKIYQKMDALFYIDRSGYYCNYAVNATHTIDKEFENKKIVTLKEDYYESVLQTTYMQFAREAIKFSGFNLKNKIDNYNLSYEMTNKYLILTKEEKENKSSKEIVYINYSGDFLYYDYYRYDNGYVNNTVYAYLINEETYNEKVNTLIEYCKNNSTSE